MENITKKADLLFKKLKTLPLVLLGEKMKERKEDYRDLRMAMKRARIPMSYEMYISNAIFYSAIISLIGAFLGYRNKCRKASGKAYTPDIFTIYCLAS